MGIVFTQNVYVGTVIVAMRTDRAILVGADSKATLLNPEREALMMCKIVQVDRVFFAFAKLARDTAGTFNVETTATQVIQQGGTIEDIILRFADLITQPLTRLLNQIKGQSLSMFNELYGSGTGSVLDGIFFGMESQTPKLYLCSLMPSPNLSSVQVQLDELQGRPGVPVYTCLGEVEQIQPILDAEPDYFERRGFLRGIESLVQLAIDMCPDKCGPPICTLRVDRAGAKWIKKAPHCPPLRRY